MSSIEEMLNDIEDIRRRIAQIKDDLNRETKSRDLKNANIRILEGDRAKSEDEYNKIQIQLKAALTQKFNATGQLVNTCGEVEEDPEVQSIELGRQD